MTRVGSRESAVTDAGRQWQPSPLIRGSIGLHVVALIGAVVLLLVKPPQWTTALVVLAVAIVANHLLLSVVGLWPRSRWLGSNLVDLHGRATAAGRVVLTIDDGPDPAVTPRVLDLLARHGARATFFLIGSRAGAHPALVRRIVAEGHGIGNHSQAHDLAFSLRGRRWLAADIARAQAVLTEHAGQAPRFFRAPAGLRSPLLDPVLARAGLQLASWTRRGFDTRTSDATRVVHRLAGAGGRRLRAGDILLLHDGHAARDADGEPVILAALERLLPLCRERGLGVVSLDMALPR